MESMEMRLTKEIDENKKKEEYVIQTLKERSDECNRLDLENEQLNFELQQSHNNEEELENNIFILRDEITIANEYKEKFKISSSKIYEILGNYKDVGDKKGLRFDKGEKFGSSQRNPKTTN
jgi:predicted nuclease with TOPRIM domain